MIDDERAVMTGVLERLDGLIDSFPTLAAFADHCGLDRALVSRLRSKGRGDFHMPRAITLIRVCRAMNVSANWLLLGEGPINGR